MRDAMRPDERALLTEFAARGGKPSLGPHVSLRATGADLGMHPKRVAYLAQKWSRKGWYDYGVSVDMGWLEPAGFVVARLEQGDKDA